MKKHTLRSLAATAVLTLGLTGPVLADDTAPVVVELFTSQGCSSCPPAEAFLHDLVGRNDVIALEYHIDYWDYIGWKDPYADPKYTNRQRTYAANLESRYVYTPQMVVDGAAHEVGSNRSAVLSLIERSKDLRSDRPVIELSHDPAGGHSVDLAIVGPELVEAYDIYMVTFDASHTTEIKRGENRGKTLENKNVVRSMTRIGEWKGGTLNKTVDLAGAPGDGGCAILIQRPGGGPILAAAQVGF